MGIGAAPLLCTIAPCRAVPAMRLGLGAMKGVGAGDGDDDDADDS